MIFLKSQDFLGVTVFNILNIIYFLANQVNLVVKMDKVNAVITI